MNICAAFLDAHLAAGAGHRPAVRADDGDRTFAEVADASGRWASILAGDDVRPGQRVVLVLPDGPALVAAFFGVLRAGAVAVLAPADLPATAIAALMDDVGASAAIVPEDRTRGLVWPARGGPRVYPAGESALQARLAAAPGMVAPCPSGSGDDAVWQLSSGTTGRPKAVMHTHGAFRASAAAYGTGVLALQPNDVTIAAPKLPFGYATGANLLFPFAAGASCVLFPERSTAEALAARIHRHRATVLVTTPAMVRQMVTHPTLDRGELASLRLATSAGEALPRGLHERWMDRFGVELLDGLGMTETCHIFLSNRSGDVTPGTLGRVLPGYEVRLRDGAGHDVPEGHDGALWVRGPSRARGYWQRPEETARAFHGDWCVSGDLLCRNPDGTYTYRGRVDDLLKVNGQWVVPGAVEACLLEFPGVHEAVVVGVADADGLIRPQAYVVAEGGGPELAARLQAFTRARLAPHAFPRAVVFLDALPRTAQGKLDRAALSRA